MLLILAMISSLDSFGVGMAYGLNGTRVRPAAHVSISTVILIITWVSVAIGNHFSHYFSDKMSHIGSAAVFAAMGIWTLMPFFKGRWTDGFQQVVPFRTDFKTRITPTKILETPLLADKDSSSDIDWSEGLSLGVALSLNNIGAGVSAGLIHITASQMALAAIVFNVIGLTSGHNLGVKLRTTNISNYALALSGVLLICVGIWKIH